jgi:hypothetical protein
MLFVKNIPAWERALRVFTGAAILAFGLYRYPASMMGYALAATGVFAALTGFVGFCPACWLVGRRLKSGG